jgi:hypothetical protein
MGDEERAKNVSAAAKAGHASPPVNAYEQLSTTERGGTAGYR